MDFMKKILYSFLILQGALFVFGSQEEIESLFMNKRTTSTCTKPSFPTSYSNMTDFNNQMKDWHNYLRCYHNAPALTINSDLVAAAQVWANQLGDDLKNTWSATHSSRCGIGENIWLGYGISNYPAWKAVRGNALSSNYGYGWYCSEYSNFNWNTQSYQSGAGHFSQVIWKLTTEIGCGVGFTSGGSPDKTIVVCQYGPGGNMMSTKCWTDGSGVEQIQNGAGTYDTVCPSTNT